MEGERWCLPSLELTMRIRTIWPLLLLLGFLPAARARVVINEIFYHAPNDIGDLEFLELHNSGDEDVDISGWSFTKGIKFKFPAKTVIDAHGFVVLCRNRQRFKQYFSGEVAGVFDSKLSNKSERLELSDARGRLVDSVKYQDTIPWPLGADGMSGSLERICPEAGGDNPANWASSPLSQDRTKPTGSPGKVNFSYSAHLPPVISNIKLAPEKPAPNQRMTVEVVVRDSQGVAEVKLLYRLAGPGFEKPESSLPMKKMSDDRYSAEIPGQSANQLVRYRIQAVSTNGARRIFPSETEPRPALSSFVHEPISPAKIPFGWMINTTEGELGAARRNDAKRGRGFDWGPLLGGRRGDASREKNVSTSSRSAFVYFDPASGKREVFDFVEVVPRSGGFKVHFGKGQMLQQMSTVNLIFEHTERFVLAEPLAYEVYRKAGIAAPQSFHVRLWLNGQPLGYHLLVEQPNRAFLRRNKIDEDGNLYKILWYERGVVGQHEKKTNVREGHDDLISLIDALEKSKGEAQWEIIRKNFDVKQVVNYFAVNMVISHWDGFFNNYFTYHDINGTGKWTMYPWDQDKTWGVYDGIRPGEVFYTMPITFGMEGDVAPGEDRDRARGFGFGRGGPAWWRPGGYFSRPMLANPSFRKLFLARTKEILETVYTEEAFLPAINAMGERLKPEVEVRARLMQTDPQRALRNMERSLQSLRDHLTKRREFLLAQNEIKNAGPFSTADLGSPPAKK
jgi:hypothetical protein